jgi:hypothetical protein
MTNNLENEKLCLRSFSTTVQYVPSLLCSALPTFRRLTVMLWIDRWQGGLIVFLWEGLRLLRDPDIAVKGCVSAKSDNRF